MRDDERMKLDGIHHITAITADAPGNVDFYARGLGLRLVKKTVNQDDPTVYHLFYADERCAVRGERRGSFYAYDDPPPEPGMQGAGSVHHVAFASSPEEHESWRQRVIEGGARPTPVIDRFYFKSIYFREPSGVLFEIATLGPGFATDEPPEHLGERLSLPPAFEHLRDRLEPVLTPLPNPGAAASRG